MILQNNGILLIEVNYNAVLDQCRIIMDYQGILKIVEKKMKLDFDYIIRDIKDCISMGSTGGEISSIVGKYLKDLEINNYQAYSILKEDIEKYLLECKKQGLYIQ